MCATLNVALADIRLTVDRLETQQATLQGLAAQWHFAEPRQPLSVSVARIDSPEPALSLDQFRLECGEVVLKQTVFRCAQGMLKLPMPQLDRHELPFSMDMQWRSTFRMQMVLPDVRVAGGRLGLTGGLVGDGFHFQSTGRQLSLPKLLGLFAVETQALPFKIQDGQVAYELRGKGIGASIQSMDATVKAEGVGGEGTDGLSAAQGVSVSARLVKKPSSEHFLLHVDAPQGEVYLDPFFVALAEHPLNFEASIQALNAVEYQVSAATLSQAGIGRVQGSLRIRSAPQVQLLTAQASLEQLDLAAFGRLYLEPLALETAWEGVQLQGKASGSADWVSGSAFPDRAELFLNQVALVDPKQRVAVNGLNVSSYWKDDRPTTLSWQSASLFNIDLGPLQSTFDIQPDTLRLRSPIQLAVLDGALNVERLELNRWSFDDRQLVFDGYLTPVSLPRLSEAFGWTPMEGAVSAVIPSVSYQHGILKLDGNVLTRLFDGQLVISHLIVQDLLSDYPILNADIRFNQFDLGQLTRHFEFGSIEGRLEGHFDGLVLENWQPVAFDAWLGTPEGDRSRHRISQKAIENISDLGGVGVAGALSRSFMRFFDTFGYKRIGIGCVLSNGICHVQGVTPAKTGYYLVQGGGLPRIDIIGHNRKILWRVFTKRLERILNAQ